MTTSRSEHGLEGFAKNLRAGWYKREGDANRALSMMTGLKKTDVEEGRKKVKRHFDRKNKINGTGKASDEPVPQKPKTSETDFLVSFSLIIRDGEKLQDVRNFLSSAQDRGYTLGQLCEILQAV